MKRPEEVLHIAVAQFLHLALKPPVWWSSIDHGAGKMSRASAGLRKARGVKAGIPDIIILWPEGKDLRCHTRVLGIELKAAKGAASPAQKETEAAWHAAMAGYVVCRSLEEVQSALNWCGFPLHASIGAKR